MYRGLTKQKNFVRLQVKIEMNRLTLYMTMPLASARHTCESN